MPTVLIASDKFKGSLTAAQVAAALSAGIGRVSGATVVTVPVADGGDGTVDAAVSAGFERVRLSAAGPTGEPVETAYARRGEIAVVEMADVSGLWRLPGGRREPLTATSRGLGEVIGAGQSTGVGDQDAVRAATHIARVEVAPAGCRGPLLSSVVPGGIAWSSL